MATKEMNQTERAAVLMLALGMDRAAQVFKHMNRREVQILGITMANVGEITPDMVDEVVEEIIRAVRLIFPRKARNHISVFPPHLCQNFYPVI